jgi:hypothetical protein
VYEGPITRSRAKLLQKEVNSLLAEINFNIHENIILPKYSTLFVLRYTNKEEDITLRGKEVQKNGSSVWTNTVKNGPTVRTNTVKNEPSVWTSTVKN